MRVHEAARTPLAIVAVLMAIFAWSVIPTRPDSYAALSLTGQIGTRLVGRNIAVTLHRVCASHQLLRLRAGQGATVYRSQGYWVVADVTIEAILTPSGMAAQLHSAGLETRQRDIGMPGIPAVPEAGLRYRQAMAFEIPRISPEMGVSIMNDFVDERTGLTMDAPLDSRIDISFTSNEVELIRQLTVGQDGTLK